MNQTKKLQIPTIIIGAFAIIVNIVAFILSFHYMTTIASTFISIAAILINLGILIVGVLLTKKLVPILVALEGIMLGLLTISYGIRLVNYIQYQFDPLLYMTLIFNYLLNIAYVILIMLKLLNDHPAIQILYFISIGILIVQDVAQLYQYSVSLIHTAEPAYLVSLLTAISSFLYIIIILLIIIDYSVMSKYHCQEIPADEIENNEEKDQLI